MVLDKPAATQRVLAKLDRQLDEFDRAAKEDVSRFWDTGGGFGEGDDKDKEGDKEEVKMSERF